MSVLDSRISEAEWQSKVIETAQLKGWAVAHFRKARTKDGWVTPVAANGKGFPDLVLVSIVGGVLFRELKAEGGRLSPEQTNWLYWLSNAGADVGVWRPSDWPTVLETLGRQVTKIRRV